MEDPVAVRGSFAQECDALTVNAGVCGPASEANVCPPTPKTPFFWSVCVCDMVVIGSFQPLPSFLFCDADPIIDADYRDNSLLIVVG